MLSADPAITLPVRIPAEWEPMQSVRMIGPHNRASWPGVDWDRLLDDYDAMAAAIARFVPVDLVDPVAIPTDDSWIRDTGPISVIDAAGREAALIGRFDAYGDQYPHAADAALACELVARDSLPVVQTRLVIEGGAIESDGRGRLLMTREWVGNRTASNGPLDSAIYRDFFAATATQPVLLPHGVAGDDTGGHIDDCARVLPDGRLLVAIESDPNDGNFAPLQANRAAATELGDVVELPMPAPQVLDGQRLPASYANYLVANGGVVVPTFACRQDDQAMAILSRVFPNRDIVGVDCRLIVVGLGAVHCLTQPRFLAASTY